MNRQFAAQDAVGKIYALLRTERPEPSQYVWNRITAEVRRDWLIFSGMDPALAVNPWKNLPKADRAQLGRVLGAMTDFFAEAGVAAQKVAA